MRKTIIMTIAIALCFGVVWASDLVIFGGNAGEHQVVIETPQGYVVHSDEGIRSVTVIRDDPIPIVDGDGNEYDNYRQYYKELYDMSDVWGDEEDD